MVRVASCSDLSLRSSIVNSRPYQMARAVSSFVGGGERQVLRQAPMHSSIVDESLQRYMDLRPPRHGGGGLVRTKSLDVLGQKHSG